MLYIPHGFEFFVFYKLEQIQKIDPTSEVFGGPGPTFGIQKGGQNYDFFGKYVDSEIRRSTQKSDISQNSDFLGKMSMPKSRILLKKSDFLGKM